MVERSYIQYGWSRKVVGNSTCRYEPDLFEIPKCRGPQSIPSILAQPTGARMKALFLHAGPYEHEALLESFKQLSDSQYRPLDTQLGT